MESPGRPDPIRIKPNPELKPQARENTVRLIDRNIVVIGGGHISEHPGAVEQTEQDIKAAFGEHVSAIAMDGYYYMDRSKIPGATTPWPEQVAIEKQIPLIEVDAAYKVDLLLQRLMTDRFNNWDFSKAGVPQSFQTSEYGNISEQQTQLESSRKDLSELAKKGSGLIAAGALMIMGLKSTKKISRRQFLSSMLTLGGIALAGVIGKRSKESQIDASIQVAEERKTQLKQEIHNLKEKDLAAISDRFKKPTVLEAADYDDPGLKRISEAQVDLSLTLLLRNALAAEVLSLPIQDIMPEFDISKGENPNIVTNWGSGHLTVPEKFRISYLVQHAQERREAMEVLFEAFFAGARESGVKAESIKQAKQEFKNFSRSIKFDKHGRAKSSPINIPALNEILDRIPS